ncbi:MAG: septum formation initiator family protein [Bacteroidales bacterium]|nr:septum formation initiator family protein [Candidatus Cryptobacteroides caccocaballi]
MSGNKMWQSVRDYIRSLFEGDNGGFFVFAVFAVGLCVAFICFLPGENLFNWLRAKSEIRRQNAQIEYYDEQIKEIDRAIETLATNKDSLERFAREQFQYASPGDDVYILEK